MTTYLHSLAIQNYRGIGPNLQRLGPFRKFNFFIGANNSGKSAVLNFIGKYVTSSGVKIQVDPLEKYRGKRAGPMAMAIGVPLKAFSQSCLDTITRPEMRKLAEAPVMKICRHISKNDVVWLKSSVPSNGKLSLLDFEDQTELGQGLHPSEWQILWRAYTRFDSGGSMSDWFAGAMNGILSAHAPTFPEVQVIPAIRKIGPRSESFDDFSGRGLIDRLAEIQNPPYDRRGDRKIFESINKFIQTVTGQEGALIEIPHDREHILVHMNDLVLPLESLGTGIHEVVMIAAFSTISKNSIICIEEPEIHLHPLLQRKLISYLSENTSNQYFIATHSAAFIDTPGAAIFHVSHDGEQTNIRESILRSDKYLLCMDLGIKASDLVQSNSIIWVEGPSDRIYLNHWISSVDSSLVEGTHYSIMFYGGRLLSHLSASDDEVADFISLKTLNQNVAIVMDSDKSSQGVHINETKKRISEEISKGRGLSWITKGREIENYIEHSKIQSAIKQIYPELYIRPSKGGVYDHALYFERHPKRSRSGQVAEDNLEKSADKVKIAKIVCEGEADLDILDLKARIMEIIDMIRVANI